tara:strand:- start:7057 stop:7800 length:744 start_codon:yes stop_codon:yes gene_type:complete
MSLTEKNIRERDFHNKLQSSSKGRFENVFYKAIYNSGEDFLNFLKNNTKDLTILDYGCGIGHSLKKVYKFNPKKISGIDISEVSIEKAKKLVAEEDLNIELSVDDCENTRFKNETFDIVYGTGILHHLNMQLCINEIYRILKPGGQFVFIEPLGTNPLINFYRKLTPNSRSEDEHPLNNQDLNLINKQFSNMNIKYYGFLTLIFFPLYYSPKTSIIFKILKEIDQFLFKINIFKKLAWSVLIVAKKN